MAFETLVSFAFTAPFLALFHFYAAREDRINGIVTSKPHMACAQLFVFCLLAVFTITGVPDVYSMRVGQSGFNLMPFDVFRTNYVQYFQNVALFMPLGFVLPAAWERLRGGLTVTLAGFALSLGIESAQLFSRRSFDIDDLMMNTLGALLGWAFFRAARAAFPRLEMFCSNCRGLWRREPWVCVLIAALFTFFARPLIEKLI